MLFKPSSIEMATIETEVPTGVLKNTAGLNRVFLSENYNQMNASLESLVEGEVYHLVSLGRWSMHHLLFHILKLTGPADVYATTWSINEDVVRHLVEGRNQGMIRSMSFIFDYRVRKYKPAAYFLAQQHFKSRVTSCHAKVTIIDNEDFHVSIIGSANYTRNDRIEVGVIFTDKVTADFHRQWIVNELNNADENL